MIGVGRFNKHSAAASTTRVFPVPVGPKNKKLPTGRPGFDNPVMNIWNMFTIW